VIEKVRCMHGKCGKILTAVERIESSTSVEFVYECPKHGVQLIQSLNKKIESQGIQSKRADQVRRVALKQRRRA